MPNPVTILFIALTVLAGTAFGSYVVRLVEDPLGRAPCSRVVAAYAPEKGVYVPPRP